MFDQKLSPPSDETVCGHKDSGWLLHPTLPTSRLTSTIKYTTFCFSPCQPLLLKKATGESHGRTIFSDLHCGLCLWLSFSALYHDSCCFNRTPFGKPPRVTALGSPDSPHVCVLKDNFVRSYFINMQSMLQILNFCLKTESPSKQILTS